MRIRVSRQIVDLRRKGDKITWQKKLICASPNASEGRSNLLRITVENWVRNFKALVSPRSIPRPFYAITSPASRRLYSISIGSASYSIAREVLI